MCNVPVEDVFIVSNRYSSAYSVESYSHETYSSTHKWSFSAGPVESGSSGHVGPCNIQSGISAPSYVGNDYYCESGTLINPDNIWYTSDPSGMAYLAVIAGLPWFHKTLSTSTTATITTRVCLDEATNNEG